MGMLFHLHFMFELFSGSLGSFYWSFVLNFDYRKTMLQEKGVEMSRTDC